MALAIVVSAYGSPGDGMAGPPPHMIAFQASHSSRSGSGFSLPQRFGSAPIPGSSFDAARAPGSPLDGDRNGLDCSQPIGLKLGLTLLPEVNRGFSARRVGSK
jgi:hypothetical protein